MSKPTNKSLRKRTRIQPIRDREELSHVAVQAAAVIAERELLAARANDRLLALKAEFATELDALAERANEHVKRLAAYCRAHREQLFGDRQAVAVAGQTLRFRKSPGKVTTTSGQTQTEALEALLAYEDEAISERYTAVKASLDKDAILRAWKESDEARDLLRSLGLEVVTPEEFKFEPDLPDQPNTVSGGKEDAKR